MFVKLGISLLFSMVVLLADGCSSKSGGNKDTGAVNAPQTASASPSNPEGANPSSAGSAGVSPASEAKPAPATSSAAANAGLDACGLIEKSEIESVQGAKVQGTVPSKRDAAGALAISQCYYTVFSADGSKNLSVHLEVTQADAKSSSSNAVRDYWEKTFRPEKGRPEGRRKRKEEGKPLPVPGIGDEAYWLGSIKAGALHVVRKDKVVRVSVGGPDDLKAKIEKSKTLAAKVLKRLS